MLADDAGPFRAVLYPDDLGQKMRNQGREVVGSLDQCRHRDAPGGQIGHRRLIGRPQQRLARVLGAGDGRGRGLEKLSVSSDPGVQPAFEGCLDGRAVHGLDLDQLQ